MPAPIKAKYIVEICPHKPGASICGPRGGVVSHHSAVIDCAMPGDCEDACRRLLSCGVDFRIVAKDSDGNYVNRLATEAEIMATARAIYYDTSFDDIDVAKVYLIWEACSHQD